MEVLLILAFLLGAFYGESESGGILLIFCGFFALSIALT